MSELKKFIEYVFKIELKPLNKKALERTCYVAGAGAFGVFIRWLQDQMAFTADGLAEKSLFHAFVVLYILGIAYLFLRFVDKERNGYRTLPETFEGALGAPGGAKSFFRWAAGLVICLGAVLLFFSSETDEDALLLRVLAGLGFLFGLSYPAFLGAANKPNRPRGPLCLAASLPVAFFALWLIISYKQNNINSVVWSYIIGMLADVVCMLSFFRLAGYVFDAPNGWRSMFGAMASAAVCIMALADSRYFGMQLMFLGTAFLMLYCNWVLCVNLQQGRAPDNTQPDDGFERLM